MPSIPVVSAFPVLMGVVARVAGDDLHPYKGEGERKPSPESILGLPPPGISTCDQDTINFVYVWISPLRRIDREQRAELSDRDLIRSSSLCLVSPSAA